jgi:hypothetical protein
MRSFAGVLLPALLATGCSLLHPARAPSGQAGATAACAAWLESADREVRRAGVGDAGAYPVPGFASFRVDRFIASFAPAAARDPRLLDAMADAMREQDRIGRDAELSNLPQDARRALGADSAAELRQHAQRCAEALASADRASPARRDLLLRNAKMPDDYSELDRVLGVYPLARVAFARGVEDWQRQARAAFAKDDDSPRPADRWVPARAATMGAQELAQHLQLARDDPLGRLQLQGADLDRLFARFAPVYRIDAVDNDDRPGAPAYTPHAGLVVDTGQPTVYRRLAYTRFQGRTLAQLVYTLWFRERPPRHALDPLAGRFDGLVYRVTLGPDGRPLIYDTMRPCGCFHTFFPTAALRLRSPPDPSEEWAFVPQAGPLPAAGERIELHLTSHDHDLVGLAARPAADAEAARPGMPAARSYELDDEDRLRALPDGDRGATRSLYGPDGLVEDSRRLERLTFWPMGISSAGTMRQWGHHATAFVGRRHFDDADLIERRFAAAD